MSALQESVRTRLDAAGKPVVRWGLGHALPRTVMRAAARRGDLQGRLIVAGSGGSDPFAVLEEVRAAGPVYRGKYAWVTPSHALVREVLTSNDYRVGVDGTRGQGRLARAYDWAAQTPFTGPLEPPSLLVTDPPDHTRYRRLVTRVFSVRAVERLRQRTQQIADDLLDDLERTTRAGTDVELVARYCALLPVTVICEVLGVPAADRATVLELGHASSPSLDMGLSWRRFRRVEDALVRFDAWLGEHLARLREQPGDDLLSELVTAREDGVGLTERELKSTAGLVLAAGFETTVNLLGNGVALLRTHPEQLQLLRERPDCWPNAVDEVLRVDPPVFLTGRTAARETELGGVRIPAGGLVTVLLAAANRDPDVFPDPARFDVTRANAKEHVSFSAGRHFCLGAALARMEGEVGLRTLFDRFPELSLRPGARRRDTRILRGYATLPVRLR